MRKIHKVTLFKGKNREWYWKRVAPNGRVVSIAGEGFKKHAYCLKSAIQYNIGCIIIDPLEV